MCAASVAIVGAGIAGLACAKELQTAGLSVQVFEKSRGLGGRSATRFAALSKFDHGAQFFTARSKNFLDWVDVGMQMGLIALWQPRLRYEKEEPQWYVGVPGMASLARVFQLDELVQREALVLQIERIETPGQMPWRLTYEKNQQLQVATFDFVILAIPGPQAAQLLQKLIANQPTLDGALTALLQKLSCKTMLPCWAIWFETNRDLLGDTKYDVWQIPEDLENNQIRWIAKNNSKPFREDRSSVDSWVVQASPEWSLEHLAEDPLVIKRELLSAFAKVTGLEIDLLRLERESFIQRWRYARVVPQDPTAKVSYYLEHIGLGICGDYFSASRIENAYLSGIDVTKQLLRNA